jgi:hypothetical protein
MILLEQINDPTLGYGFIATIVGSLILVIKKVTDLISEWLSKEMAFRQTNRHARMQLELDLDIESKKQELKRHQILEDKKLEDSLSANLLEDALKIQSLLKVVRERLDAQGVGIALYHNGIAKGFKNFSIRYEEVRDSKFSIIPYYQSKPLSPFYPTIKEFENKNVIMYRITDPITDNNKEPLSILRLAEVKAMIVVPILVPVEHELPSEHTTMVIKRFNGEHYILGFLCALLDDQSKNLGELELLSYLVNKADDIVNIYLKNFKVFG